jgi:hypothetical protein
VNGGYIIAIVTLAVSTPPSLLLTWMAIKKDRAEAADRLEKRLESARESGRIEAMREQRITDLEEQLSDRHHEGEDH